MGVAAHSPLAKSKFPQGEKKITGALEKCPGIFFFSVFVIIKSSDGIRSRRKGRGDSGLGEGKCPRWALHLPLFWQGNQGEMGNQGNLRGEKCKTKPEKWDRRTRKQKKRIPKGRKVSDAESQLGRWAEGLTCARLPTCHQSARVRTWLCLLLS